MFILYRSFFLSMRYLPILTLKRDKVLTFPLFGCMDRIKIKNLYWSRVNCSLWRIFFKKIILDMEDKVYILGFDKRVHEWKIDLDENMYRGYVYGSWESLLEHSHHNYTWKNKIWLTNYRVMWNFWAHWGYYIKKIIVYAEKIIWNQTRNFNISAANATRRWHFFFLLFWHANIANLQKELPQLEAKDIVYTWSDWLDNLTRTKLSISASLKKIRIFTYLDLLFKKNATQNYNIRNINNSLSFFRSYLCNTILFPSFIKQILLPCMINVDGGMIVGRSGQQSFDLQKKTVLSKKVFSGLLDYRIGWTELWVLLLIGEEDQIFNNFQIDFFYFYICLYT